MRSGLQGGSNVEDATEAHESVESAEFFVEEGGGDGTEERTRCEE